MFSVKVAVSVPLLFPLVGLTSNQFESSLTDQFVFESTENVVFPDESDTLTLDHAPEGYESEPQDSPEKMEQTGTSTIRGIVYPRADENNARPRYPMMARRRGYEGVVILRVLVSRDGEALDVRISETSGYSMLDEEAKKAVKKFLFEPGKEDGVITDMWVNIPIRFQLK